MLGATAWDAAGAARAQTPGGNPVSRGAIAPGARRIDTLATVGDVNIYTITLNAGDTISPAVEAVRLPGGLEPLHDPALRILDSAGVQLANNDDRQILQTLQSQIWNPLVFRFIASYTGTYQVEVSYFDNSNTGVYRLRVLGGSLPDIRANALTIGGFTTMGGSGTFTGSVTNIGSAPVTDTFRIVITSGWTQGVRREYFAPVFPEIGECVVPGLAVSATASCSGTAFLPPFSSTTVGEVTLRADIDGMFGPSAGWDRVPEEDEPANRVRVFNNYVSQPIAPSAIVIPSVALGSSTPSSLTANQRSYTSFVAQGGDSVEVRATSAAFNTILMVFDSAGRVMDFNDDDGVSTDSRIALRMPFHGTFYAAVFANGGASGAYLLHVNRDALSGAANLIASFDSVPPAAAAGTQHRFRFTVYNVGGVAVPATVAATSFCPVPTGLCTGGGSIAVPPIAAGGQVTVDTLLLVPLRVFGSGAGIWRVNVDQTRLVDESIEDDNLDSSSAASLGASPVLSTFPAILGGTKAYSARDLDGTHFASQTSASLYRYSHGGGLGTSVVPYRNDLTFSSIRSIARLGRDLIVATFASGQWQVHRVPPTGPAIVLYGSPTAGRIEGLQVRGGQIHFLETGTVSSVMRLDSAGFATVIGSLPDGNGIGMTQTPTGFLVASLALPGVFFVAPGQPAVSAGFAPMTGVRSVARAASGRVYVGTTGGDVWRLGPGLAQVGIAITPVAGQVSSLTLGPDSVLVVGQSTGTQTSLQHILVQDVGVVPVPLTLAGGSDAGLNVPLSPSIDLLANVSSLAGARVGSVDAVLTWDSSLVRFDSMAAGSLGPVTPTRLDSVRLQISANSVAGAGGQARLARAWFTSRNTTGTAQFRASLRSLFTTTLGELEDDDTTLVVAVSLVQALRGDVTRDSLVNATDALAILSSSVGLTLPAGWRSNPWGDADCNGLIEARDALIVLSRTVGLNMSAFCVGTTR